MRTPPPPARATARCRLPALAAAALLAAGCNTVEFYEMEAFGRTTMRFDEGAAEPHLHQKVHYSMEGSAGGIGTSAGGGCGCY